MRWFAAILWLLAVAACYGLGVRGVGGDLAATSTQTLESAVSSRNPLNRSFEISRFFRSMDAEGVEDALRVVEDSGFWFDQQEHRLLMSAWVPIDSLAAVDWAFSRPGLLRRRAQIALADALGFDDAAEARALISTLESIDDAELLHKHMVNGWARSDQRGMLTRYLEKLPEDTARKNATTALAKQILREGPEELIAWVDSIDPDEETRFKRTAFEEAADAMAHVDPARASQWLDEHLGQGYATSSAKSVASRWSEQDPAAALDWLATRPENGPGPDLVKRVFSDWLKADPDAAEEWARSAAPARGVDPAVRVLVRRYFDQRPDKAMEWAHRIQKEVTRLRVQASAGRAWYGKDPEAFMAWLPDSGLEEQIQDLILNRAGKAGGPDDDDGLGAT